jgi:hypothetical protein
MSHADQHPARGDNSGKRADVSGFAQQFEDVGFKAKRPFSIDRANTTGGEFEQY